MVKEGYSVSLREALNPRLSRRKFLALLGAAGVTVGAYEILRGSVLKSLQPAYEEQITNASLTKVRTAHVNNCDGSCGLLATLNGGEIVKFSPATFNDPDFPPRICLRGLSQIQYVYHPDRLKYPMQSVGGRGSGQWKQITWDEAASLIASKFQSISSQYGSKSIYIAPYTGNLSVINGLIGVGYRFASVIGASAGDFEGDNEGDSASPAGAVEELGAFDGHELNDLVNSNMIILWGNNLAETDIPDMRFVLDARDNGARVVYIDPRYTPTAVVADQWVPLRPGTDGALALSMINVIINEGLYNSNYMLNYTVGPFLVRQDTMLFLRENDLSGNGSNNYMVYDTVTGQILPYNSPGVVPALTGTYKTANGVSVKTSFQMLSELVSKYDPSTASNITGVPAQAIQQLAEDFAKANPAAIKVGFGGISHWYYGDLTYRALITLSALIGYIGVHGGGVTTYNGALLDAATDLTDWLTPDGKQYNYIPPLSFADQVFNGNIKAAWFPCDNFINQQGDTNRTIKAIEQLDFVVVSDAFMTPTAKYADIVLPIATEYEKTDLLLGGNFFLQYTPKLIEPLWESMADLDMFALVASKMGYGSYFNGTAEDYIGLVLSGFPSGTTLDDIKANGNVMRLKDEDIATSSYQPITKPYVPFYQQSFPTPSGRIEFYVESVVPYYKTGLPIYKEPNEASPQNVLYTKYPFVMITSHTRFRTHTQWDNLAWLLEINPHQFVEINPSDAAAKGINDGDKVKIYNDRGYIITTARLTPGMRPGVLNVYQGHWSDFPTGTVNNLTNQDINPAQSVVYLFQSNTPYFDVLVNIEKVSS
ncbi:MAG: molybdopterin-dependent oxidoreductase [Conexivisphaerales archaeon]